MKKLLIMLICLSGLAMSGLAQTSQGSVMVGGGIAFSSTTQELTPTDQKTTQFQFSPNAGYFVANNLAVGVNLSLLVSNTKATNTFKSSTFAAGPFARYYMFTANEKFAFTGEAGVSFGSVKSTSAGIETKGSTINLYLSPGFTYFFSDKWGLDFQLQGITFSSTDPNKDVDNDKRNSFLIGARFFSPSLGFRYYISK